MCQRALVASSPGGMVERILAEFKRDMPSLFSIGKDGKVILNKSDLSAKFQISTYLLGAAYAKIAELREDDAVSNKEIIEQLKLKKGTVDPTLKTLREEGLAIQKDSGLHHINYNRIKELLDELKAG